MKYTQAKRKKYFIFVSFSFEKKDTYILCLVISSPFKQFNTDLLKEIAGSGFGGNECGVWNKMEWMMHGIGTSAKREF